KITQLNNLLSAYATKHDISYVDYYDAMVMENLSLNTEYAEDGVHPNKKGYSVMEPLVEQAIENLK
ncbi:GDSL-type esterase/lipase family protein, partial [Mesonia mobilis]